MIDYEIMKMNTRHVSFFHQTKTKTTTNGVNIFLCKTTKGRKKTRRMIRLGGNIFIKLKRI